MLTLFIVLFINNVESLGWCVRYFPYMWLLFLFFCLFLRFYAVIILNIASSNIIFDKMLAVFRFINRFSAGFCSLCLRFNSTITRSLI